MPPKWPARALGAIVALFRPLQDIDVYVEDEGSEAFYSALIRRIAPEGVRVQRVFPLQGRLKVLDGAKTHDFTSRPALFVVDGDYEWVRGEPPPSSPGVYRLDAYCVENLLVCENAATQFLMECEACDEATARTKLDFSAWAKGLSCLVELFAAWAVLNKLAPATATVSTGLSPFLVAKTGATSVDPALVGAAHSSAVCTVSAQTGGSELLSAVQGRVAGLAFPLDAASGKDFVLLALRFHIRAKTKEKFSLNSLKFRLARLVAPSRFAGLGQALLRAASANHVHT